MFNKNVKKMMFLITYAVAIFFIFNNINIFWNGVCKVVNIVMPFIYGFVIAYIINWPFEFFRQKVFYKLREKNSKDILNKTISASLSYILVFGIFVFIITIVVPQMIVSINQLLRNSSIYISSFKEHTESFLQRIHILDYIQTQTIFEKVIAKIDTDYFLTKAIDCMKNFAVITYNWIIGIIVSIYLIFNKTDLIEKVKKIAIVCMVDKVYSNVSEILSMSHNVFGKFIIGKIIDSLIIGILCFIGTSILSIPYALLISVVVGVTNIIPFFGPFLGAIPSIFILIVIDPIKALWFAIFILILQQIDGNIIGPKILGNSVGISGIFIMFSVIIGGGLFGVPGMILGVPVFVVIYNIIGNTINKRANEKLSNLSV